jgi:hypothetical protein
MAKKITDYYCKDCGLNNNGWCPKLKRNGLKEITEAQCGGNKIPNILDMSMPQIAEDDILAKASKVMPEKLEGFTPNKVDTELLKTLKGFLKDNLQIDSTTRPGLTYGSKIVTVTISFDDEPICDTDFYIN